MRSWVLPFSDRYWPRTFFSSDGRICDLTVGHGGVILGHADVVDLLAAAAALEAGEGVVAEDAGHLAGTVGAEVHEDDGVAVLHAAALTGDTGQNELVGLVVGVGCLNGLLQRWRAWLPSP